MCSISICRTTPRITFIASDARRAPAPREMPFPSAATNTQYRCPISRATSAIRSRALRSTPPISPPSPRRHRHRGANAPRAPVKDAADAPEAADARLDARARAVTAPAAARAEARAGRRRLMAARRLMAVGLHTAVELLMEAPLLIAARPIRALRQTPAERRQPPLRPRRNRPGHLRRAGDVGGAIA